jgi:hypothetical protein
MTSSSTITPGKVGQRQEPLKAALLDQLKKTPIIQVACEKTGVGRATFYRWRKDDAEFSEAVDEALISGSQLVNDMAESQLMSAIRDKNLTAIIYWLKHNHPKYATRIELNGRIKVSPEELTPEQTEAVSQALRLANLTDDPSLTDS